DEEYSGVAVVQQPTREVGDSKGDYSRYQATEDLVLHASQGSLKSSPTPISPFIRKLVDALENPKNSQLIGWSDDGTSFIIHNRKDFVKE
ncbi:hypothetical protein KXV68_009016, partial [Aspergillus fumigatus]